MDNLTNGIPIEVKDELLNLAPEFSWGVTKTNDIVLCKNGYCALCIFNTAHTKGTVLDAKSCKNKREAWLKSLDVDWSKVPIDTKVLVRIEYTAGEKDWAPKHFAGMYTNDLGKTYPSYYASGTTSWSSRKAGRIPVTDPNNIRLGVVEEEDNHADV